MFDVHVLHRSAESFWIVTGRANSFQTGAYLVKIKKNNKTVIQKSFHSREPVKYEYDRMSFLDTEFSLFAFSLFAITSERQ